MPNASVAQTTSTSGVVSRPIAGRTGRPHVVIVGGGFGGLTAARALKHADVDVTIVDRVNHHLFQPLLYQVATAVLAPSDITVPIRWVLRRQRNALVLMAEAREIDVERRIVYLDDERRELPYDYLIVAAGARHSYFGHDDWEDTAPGLKSIADAYEMRRRFLMSFELAEKADDPAVRLQYQTFVIVGGGPTGVELVGMIPDTARGFCKDFRRIDASRTRVILIEGGPRLLAAFPESLSARAKRDLEGLGVEVRLGSVVTRVEPDGVYIGDEHIATRTVFWAAGNAASPLGRMLGAPVDRAGRVHVDPDLSIPGHPEVFAVGDLAAYVDRGAPVPGVAPAANQMGAHAAKQIVATLRGEPRAPFRYFNKGDLATIGRHRAVARFGKLELKGWLAWWFWLFVHLLYLVGFRNRVSVLLQWGYAYFTYQRGVRLISGEMTRQRRFGAPADRPAASPPVPGWK
ncbi:Pyridine nucleotide-disulfide oxidoreductase, FAD/NAD(P)-binding domain protein [Gemmatirosa kalamazoonensis]|uniref:NADH:ubiquinone reductase (non-electrogenic) n=1 Tax=Gemmatirosa kalamazoonensis TaxID=861299 RepID=W0R901_9BACT|nr:NAD(P)/FAD-dependent oxidoreductase [Gemmatirosa kalamazoonensis]AHG87599.1 Pyridine nucleotide-disulfide oxidoreductase, FAD/NAD(P)-binding domain protein [Gemmatirosa kalamazoonensis]